ncbi:helix-turn-helix domain-containing protein [uncultured Dokdonia sp.]|uniref:helix-turn-helix domain-containing protein n=1 Tax=uncultured Dokdonia sp. TaxID=575653 RepID=UPI00261DD8CA|nr:helix-turn-helix domain-containing protein [uncultured Dokdonia sp.]
MKIILKRFYIFIVFYITCTSSTIYSQNENLYTIPDSLVNKSDDYFIKQAEKYYQDTTKIRIYYSSLLTRATLANDSIKRIQALAYLAYFQKEKKKKIQLIETAISEINDKQNIELITVYNTAGIIYHNQYLYKNAINLYLKELELSEKYNSQKTKHVALNNIAEIKNEIGKYNDALDLYKQNLAYKNSRVRKDSASIMIAKFNIAESFRYLKKYDSSTYYYNQIIDEPFNDTYYHMYKNMLHVNEGINLFNQNKYTKAKKLIIDGSFKMELNTINQKYYILSKFYLGKINSILTKDEIVTEKYFHTVDSLLTATNSIIPETRQVYEYFLKKHKNQGELHSQLQMIDKIVYFDSIVNARKINTTDILHSEFDIPQLIKDREIIIEELKDTNSILSNRSILLVLSIFVLAFLFVFQYRKHKIYKKRFNELVANPIPINKKISTHTTEENKKPEELNIDEKLVSKILKQLEHFEKNNLFTKRDITINSLAKSFSTNTRYLSKVINFYKEKKFIHYINDLRIEYILEELKTNTILQRYTIKSISEEAGFNTAESFATAFKKKTGLKPSYFIRNIKKRENI